jgi:hypothetical protein
MRRCVCILPKAIETLCETGCVYRESAFKHLACQLASKNAFCAAPCPPGDCDCKNNKTVCDVLKEGDSRVQVQMR